MLYSRRPGGMLDSRRQDGMLDSRRPDGMLDSRRLGEMLDFCRLAGMLELSQAGDILSLVLPMWVYEYFFLVCTDFVEVHVALFLENPRLKQNTAAISRVVWRQHRV